MKEDIIQEQDVPIEEDDIDIPTDDVDFEEVEEEITVDWDKDEFEEETRTEAG